ncbi:MAG: class I SAM-dependent methyltransferase [Alphaproteobacteria bacterium]
MKNSPTAAAQSIATWYRDSAEENGMEDEHDYLWQRMIEKLGDLDLTQAAVLDFGCNQGGFLRRLYQSHPYRLAVGVDIALESLARAAENKSAAPIRYHHASAPDPWQERYDCAFSHEVVYLLPDLAAHARQIHQVLKPGGVYYYAIGCHTENPLWPAWTKLIAETSNLPVQDYALDDYARAFWSAGFEVSAQKYLIDDFIKLKPDNTYFPRVIDSLNYHVDHKILFRCRKT